MDGTAFGSLGLAGGGGIFRNSKGFIKGCFTVLFRYIFAIKADLLAVIHALEIANENYWEKFWLESDLMYVVDLLFYYSHFVPWCYRARWSIFMYFISFISFKVSHIF